MQTPLDSPGSAFKRIGGRNLIDVTALCALLAAVAWYAYHPVGGFEFTNYDDPVYVGENLRVREGLTWQNVQWALTTGYAENWHPLTWISHMLDWQWFGGDSGRHHLMNAAIHVANTLLLFLLMTRMTGAAGRSAAVAALFALHPMNVESVAWVAERKNLLSTFFWLLTTWAYSGYARRPGVGRYLLVLLLLALGLMSKAMLVTLPFVLLLLDYWPLRRLQSDAHRAPATPDSTQSGFSVMDGTGSKSVPLAKLILEKLPMLALSLASCIVTVVVAEGAVAADEKLSLSVRLATAVVAYPLYLGKLIFPADLAVLYPHPGFWPWWQVAGSLALLGFISLVAAGFARSRSYLIIGWLWFLGTLVPVLGLVQVSAHSIADRYAYVSFIGLFIMAVWAVTDLAGHLIVDRKQRTIMLGAVTAMVLGACLVTTRRQLGHWQNSVTLFSHTVAVTTDNPNAQYNLGQALSTRGQLEPALAYYEKAVWLKPRFAAAHNNLGLCFFMLGRFNEATNHYVRALELKPDDETANLNYGMALQMLGKPADALAPLEKALRGGSADDLAHNALGKALLALARTNEAIGHFSEAIRLTPHSSEPRFSLGLVLAQRGRPAEAESQFRELLRLDPRLAAAQLQLANVLQVQGKSSEAAASYREVLRQKPNLVEALNNLAWLLATHPQAEIRNGAEAVQLAERACDLAADKVPVLVGTLAAAYAEVGRFDDATKAARKARELALSNGETDLAEQNLKMQQLYQSGKPFRQPP